jgi:ethanolamine utilization protein EutJ
MDLKSRTLSNFAELVRTGECKKYRGRLKVGVDLGTANTVLAVVDTSNRPIAGISAPSHAIQDGVIVSYYESVQLVSRLKETLEERLGTELPYAAAAIPPGVNQGSVKSIGYVLEGAGFEVTNIVDEPTAASAVLKITDGAVVDVGGGTTGISILKDGKVIYTDDEATGGTHMTMTVAGHYRIPYEEAEVLKTQPDKQDEIFPVIKATVEKMALITEKFLKGYEVPAVYVVGGSSMFREFTSVFEKKLKLPVYQPVHPLLVTPLGIAYCCQLPELKTK